jgi:hypothetical protein
MADSSEPGRFDLKVYQGAKLDKTFTWKDSGGSPIDITGYTARAQIRDRVGGAVILNMTSGTGEIVLGDAAGTIQLLVLSAVTAALKPVDGVWDLELVTAGGEVTRLLEGKGNVFAEVTR